MKVEVVYALPGAARSVTLSLPAGATVGEALRAAGLPETGRVGVFGERVGTDRVLADGDRVEIYRPLAVDPKEARRKRARAADRR